MKNDLHSLFRGSPFETFPYKTFLQVIDKMEYLGEEASPYEVSPGTDLCLSDTYYSLGFLSYLHSFGKVCYAENDDKWSLNPKSEVIEQKPYRFGLISEAVDLLNVLREGDKTIEELKTHFPDMQEKKIETYLKILNLLSQKGKIVQKSKGWDSTFILTKWD